MSKKTQKWAVPLIAVVLGIILFSSIIFMASSNPV